MSTRNPLAAFAAWADQRKRGGYAEYSAVSDDWKAMEANPTAFLRYHILRGEEQLLDCFPGALEEYIYPERREGRPPPLRSHIPAIWWDIYKLFPSCVQFLALTQGRVGDYHRPFEIEYRQAMANVVAEALMEMERLVRESRYADRLPPAHPLNGDVEGLAVLQAFNAALVAHSVERPPATPIEIIPRPHYPEGSVMDILLGSGPSEAPFRCENANDARQLALGLVREAFSFLSLADERSVPTLGWRFDALLWYGAYLATVHNPAHIFSLTPQAGSGEDEQTMYEALIGEVVRSYEILTQLLGERWTALEAHHDARLATVNYVSYVRQLLALPLR